MRDSLAFVLALLAAMWAESIPLCAVLICIAGVVAFLPARSSGSYYRVCPYCGAHLDPGERCDCGKKDRSGVTSTETAKGTGKNTKSTIPPIFYGVKRGKSSMNNDLLEAIYMSYDNIEAPLNPFEQGEAKKLYENFCEAYITNDDYDKQEKMWFDFTGVLSSERRTAFKIGFQAAIKLLTECFPGVKV